MKTVQNDLDSNGLSWTDAVDLAQNGPLSNQWRYALVVVQAGEEEVDRGQQSIDGESPEQKTASPCLAVSSVSTMRL